MIAAKDVYARAALDRECSELASASAGRNENLNRSAFALGQFVGADRLARTEVEEALYAASESNGYISEHGPSAARATIRSGIEKGILNPRENETAGRPQAAPAEQREASATGLPDWTPPGANGWPKFEAIGKTEPPHLPDEVPGRRHLYRRDGEAVRMKIKRQGGGFVDFYRVRRPDTGESGWQCKKPNGYRLTPYVSTIDPFDASLLTDPIFVPEGEKDTDTLAALGLPALTFGGASDRPKDAANAVAGRHIVILADNDAAGRGHAQKLAASLAATAASVKIVNFPETPEKADVTDWFERHGGTTEALWQRVDAAKPFKIPETAQRLVFKNLAAFCAEYTPLSYTIEGVARSASLYTLTAKTGAGKTAFNVVAALAIATGRADILGSEVVRGRVAYCAFENPDDIRMRFKIASFLLNIDLRDIEGRIVILDRRAKPEDALAELQRMADVEPFAAVFVDTFAAFFDGKDVNDNVQAGEFTRRLRPFTQIAGLPSVFVSSHPVKNAPEDNLVPYGGGAILNEVDGNLTLWKRTEGTVSLHWQGKLRGLEFAPLPFRFEITGSPDILDAKGRQVQLPTLRPSTEQFAEEKQLSDAETNRALLMAIIADPAGTQQSWSTAIGRSKSSVNVRLQKLKGEKLVESTLGKWGVTQKGRKAGLGLHVVGAAEQPPERDNA